VVEDPVIVVVTVRVEVCVVVDVVLRVGVCIVVVVKDQVVDVPVELVVRVEKKVYVVDCVVDASVFVTGRVLLVV